MKEGPMQRLPTLNRKPTALSLEMRSHLQALDQVRAEGAARRAQQEAERQAADQRRAEHAQAAAEIVERWSLPSDPA
jgi:septal ring factor EnvC (AmiA/AmiB activator)